MAPRRRVIELATSEREIETLTALSRSRTEPASRVSRAAILLAYDETPSLFAVGRRLGVHHQTWGNCGAIAPGKMMAGEGGCPR
jgi:hypothetical protein